MTETPAPRRGGRQNVPRPDRWEPGPPAPFRLGAVPSLADVVAAVPPADGPMLPAFPDARHSAVLILLSDGGAGPEVLLTRRSWALRHHRGEVSFPGGRVDPGETPTETALREAYEEVGLDPANRKVNSAVIREGLTLSSYSELLAAGTGIPEEDFEEAIADYTSYGLPEDAVSLEGYLFPATYAFSRAVRSRAKSLNEISNGSVRPCANPTSSPPRLASRACRARAAISAAQRSGPSCSGRS